MTPAGIRSWLAVWLATALVTGCSSKSEVEQQRDANAAAAEQEVVQSPLVTLKRSGTLTKSDREAWHKVLQWPATCEEAFAATAAADAAGVVLHAAGSGVSIVEVRCASGGYQPTQVFVRLDERGSSPLVTVLRFPVAQSDDGRQVTTSEESELAGDVVVAADGRSLSVLAVSRQLRDCGIWTRYAIGSEHPRVLAMAARLPCPSAPGEAADASDGNSPNGWRPLAPATAGKP